MKYRKESEYAKRMVLNSQDRTLSLYENGKFLKVFEDVSFGKNGVCKDKKEGDLCTPMGIFPLGFAFGTKDLNFTYPYYQINDAIHWVSDSASKYYNNWVEVTKKRKDFAYSYMNTSSSVLWEDAEHLMDYSQYELALVIEYNVHPIKKEKGSAIFLHVKEKDYTTGCIATSKENIEFIICWLGDKRGVIEIK